MSLSFKEKTQNLLSVGRYIAAGGIGSLLIVFLLRNSLSLDNRSAKDYYRRLQVALQKIHQLDKNLVALQSGDSDLENLESQTAAATQGLVDLKDTPNFLSQAKQDSIEASLETKESLLASQSKLTASLRNSQKSLIQSCSKIADFKQETVDNQTGLGRMITNDRQLLTAINSLIDASIIYCQNRKTHLREIVENQISEINFVIETQQLDKSKFLVNELVDYSQNIITQSKTQADLAPKISLDSLISELEKLNLEYLDIYQQQLRKTSNYRLISTLFVLAIVIFVAYKIISNLARTNRNIVKILEGFTQELETKVEERTSQLEESILKTETALAQAQNANQAKSRFLANMSHELRTPLNAILGFTQLMTRDTSIGREQQENLKIINRSGEHLLKLINDILEMSKIEVGQITINESQFDLHLMLKSIEEMLRLKANAKKLNLNFEIASDVPRFIETDEGKLRQILINLLGNSLKFTQTGSIILKVRKESNQRLAQEQIEFLFTDTYSLYFAVEDTGPGIEPEEIEQLFTPFEQTKVGRVSNEGTGLGLSICHKFVELMGGELEAESMVGQGSIFYFQLPLREQSGKINIVNQDGDLGKVMGLADKSATYKILAVDDVAASRLLLNKLLTTVGFEVKEAGDGQEAISLWQEWQPDLILMDMRMPIIDGYEATRQIKAQDKGKDTIIVALTASAFEEERIEILSAGCDDFMRKPFKEEELLAKIGQYLNVTYLYEQTVETNTDSEALLHELTQASLAVMPKLWRSQLYDAAAQVDNQEIFQLLQEIPDEYQSLAQGLADLAEQFRCDKIIDLAKSAD